MGKIKNALSPLQETKRRKTLCGTTLLAAPSRDAAPHCPPSRADGITPVKRPYLLTRCRFENETFSNRAAVPGTPARLMENSTRLRRYQTGIHSILKEFFNRVVFQQEAPRGYSSGVPRRLPTKRQLSLQVPSKYSSLSTPSVQFFPYLITPGGFVNRFSRKKCWKLH